MPMRKYFCLAVLCLAALPAAAAKKKEPRLSPLDQYVADAENRSASETGSASPGSLWSPTAALTDLGRDLKASRLDDLVTIVVSERASAVAKGSTKTARKSSTKFQVDTLAGKIPAGRPLPSLLSSSGDTALDGQGSTTRENVLTTTLTARVTKVLPNGYLVLEGTKNVVVNSESQLVTVRGMARPFDITPSNQLRSDRLAQMDVRINGKGVVGDAVKRPFFLYRLLLGLLPI